MKAVFAVVVVLLVAGSLSGCGKARACKEGTMFVSFTFDGASQQPDSLTVAVTLDSGETVSKTFPNVSRTGSVEIDFPKGYPAGRVATLVLTAKVGSMVTGIGSSSVTLENGCTAASLTVASPTVDDAGVDAGGGSDAGGVDAGTDAGTDAGSAADAGSDAGSPVDGGSDAGSVDDAGSDAGITTDAGSDAGSTDAGPSTDAGTDAGVCTGLLTLLPGSIALPPDDVDVALGDFNEDGALDAVIPGRFTNALSLVPGNGDGTFQTRSGFQGGFNPLGVAVGDFNGDHHLDVVTAGTAPAANVLLGNGNGTFQPRVSYTSTTGTSDVAVGDLNNDGRLDLVIANFGPDTVSVMKGDGDGGFLAPADTAAGAGAGGVITGFLNADSNLDVVVLDTMGDAVAVLLGNGDGTLQPLTSYATDQQPSALALGDLNGDGKLDIVVTTSSNVVSTSVISVLLGNGDGTFAPKTSVATGRFPSSVALADLDGDGKLDIVAACPGDSTVSVNRGDGDGGFFAVQPFSNGSNGPPIAIAVANLNDAGLPDVFVVTGNDTANVFLGCGP